jgi:hypothetical protein
MSKIITIIIKKKEDILTHLQTNKIIIIKKLSKLNIDKKKIKLNSIQLYKNDKTPLMQGKLIQNQILHKIGITLTSSLKA